MDIEEEIYHQPEFWGEFPQIPQWSAIIDEIIADTTEVSNVYPIYEEPQETTC